MKKAFFLLLHGNHRERSDPAKRKRQGSDGWDMSSLAGSPSSKPAPSPPCFLINPPWRPENVECEGKIKMIFKTGLPYPYSCVPSHAQSCLTLCDPVDCSLPGSSVHGILQARILKWVDMPSSSGSSPSRNQTHVSCISGGFFTTEPLGTPYLYLNLESSSFTLLSHLWTELYSFLNFFFFLTSRFLYRVFIKVIYAH